MFPQFCCQNIILGFFKCCKINSCHLRYIDSLFLTQNTYNSLCHIFPVKNSMDIEKRSFEIITEELGDTKLVPGTELIVKRCIHTSADFDYAENLCFSENAVEKAIAAIKDGACIVTDTHMAESGINKRVLSRYG